MDKPTVYRTFVHPHLEYAASAWIPHQVSHFSALGSVQRWFTRQVPGIGKLPFEKREKVCGLDSIAARTRRGITIETFKMSRGLSSSSKDILTHPTHEHSTRGRNAGNFSHIKPKKDVRKYSFRAVAPLLWDSVGYEARDAETVNGYKNAYDRQFGSAVLHRNKLF